MTSRILLRGGCVLTLGAKSPNLREGDVLIEGDRVAEVGRGLRARDAELIDATDTIVMPGFVDAHRHVWRSLFRNAGDGASAVRPAARNAERRKYSASARSRASAFGYCRRYAARAVIAGTCRPSRKSHSARRRSTRARLAPRACG